MFKGIPQMCTFFVSTVPCLESNFLEIWKKMLKKYVWKCLLQHYLLYQILASTQMTINRVMAKLIMAQAY